MKPEIKNKIESYLDVKINSSNPVGGGCINEAQIITTSANKSYFLKTNFSSPSDMFLKEANGLKELSKPKVIRVPQVITVDSKFILLENIKAGSRSKNFWENFGRNFARLHKYHSDSFGFFEDNYIGSTNQLNLAAENEKNNWKEFYLKKRLMFQINLAEKNNYLRSELSKAFGKLESKIDAILDDGIKPSLLHGDLWSGNFILDDTGNAALIDPAVYYGDREADLAMTKLFGGFDQKFYSAYNEEFPLREGYQFRENIYKLYHVLNHLNLFGSGYYHQAVSLINYYI